MSIASTALNLGRRTLAALRPEKVSGYRLFDVELLRKVELSPSLCRLVFGGADVARMQMNGPDQRVKLFFPAVDGSPPSLPHGAHWSEVRRALPAAQRPPMRTYTLRALRSAAGELDIDFVLHGVNGPASAWATHAQAGDRLQIVAPNGAFAGDPGGYEWHPPAGVRRVLLVGDETALPAIAGIFEALAEQVDPPQVQAYVEVPLQADCLGLACPAGTTLHWLPRDVLGSGHGQAMIDAVTAYASLAPGPAPCADDAGEEPDAEERLWELAEPSAGSDFYAWIAGESASVMQIRRHLLSECAMDRRQLSLMGYWRQGRSLE